MADLSDLRPGDLMFGPIGGIIPGFFPVGVGQLLFKAATHDTFNIRHVGVIVQEDPPRMVQAMPHGAEEIFLDPAKHWTSRHHYVRPAYGQYGPINVPNRAEHQALAVTAAARRYVGTPYSFLDYLALTGLHLGIENGPVRSYVRDSGHMICSQLADQALTDAGFHVFDDGRLPQDVMPAELFAKLLSMPGTQLLSPRWGWFDPAN